VGALEEMEMRVATWCVLGLLLMAGPAFAQKIYIDYDSDAVHNDFETFAWMRTDDTSLAGTDPLLHSRIVNGIEYYLTLAGAKEVDSDPDVYVTYHTSTKTEVSVNTDYWGYGYPSSWYYGGYYGRYGYAYAGPATTTVSTYERGTLVVDVWSADRNELVWRGMATNIAVTENPKKMEKRVDKALKKMVSRWQKIKRKLEREAAKAKG
jgi:hypothetical protein